MSDVSKRIDQFLADLKRLYARGGLTYGEAVILDDMISAFERIRAVKAAEDPETGSLDTLLPESRFGGVRRGKNS